ncbi:MAG: hypothetical protein ACOC2H_00380 [Spirochaetota bacterium]
MVQLRKEIQTFGAVFPVPKSIIGTGAFVSTVITKAAVGPVVIAAGIALCNAFSSAQFAANFPYAKERKIKQLTRTGILITSAIISLLASS